MAAIHSFILSKTVLLAFLLMSFGHLATRNIASFHKPLASPNEARLADLSLFPEDRADFFLLDCKTQSNALSKQLCKRLLK